MYFVTGGGNGPEYRPCGMACSICEAGDLRRMVGFEVLNSLRNGISPETGSAHYKSPDDHNDMLNPASEPRHDEYRCRETLEMVQGSIFGAVADGRMGRNRAGCVCDRWGAGYRSSTPKYCPAHPLGGHRSQMLLQRC